MFDSILSSAPILIQIILKSVFATLLSQVIGFYLVYSTPKYKSAVNAVEHIDKLLKSSKKANKSRLKEQKMAKQASLTLATLPATVATMITMLVTVKSFNASLSGTPVGVLPFQPIPPFHWITHRKLPGTDYNELSHFLIYGLTSGLARVFVQRALGIKIPKSQGLSGILNNLQDDTDE